MISNANLQREESKSWELSLGAGKSPRIRSEALDGTETEELSKQRSEIVNGVFSRLRFNLLRASRFEEKHYVIDAIKQIAIRILFVLQAVFLAALLPWPLKGAAIVMTSLGAPFLAGFFFLRESFYPSEWAESSSLTSLDAAVSSS